MDRVTTNHPHPPSGSRIFKPGDALLRSYLYSMVTGGHAMSVDGRFTVDVFRYGDYHPINVLKFTSQNHRIATGRSVSVASLQHFRGALVDDQAEDPREGALHFVSPSIGTMTDESGNTFQGELTSVGFLHDAGWILCTSCPPTNKRDWIKLRKYFENRGKPAVQSIENPSTFAMRLGVDFGRHTLANLKEFYSSLDRDHLIATRNSLSVWHGAVKYMNPVARDKYLEELNREDPAVAAYEALFTKDDRFKAEREYRFFISSWRRLRKDHIICPLGGVTLEHVRYGEVEKMLEDRSRYVRCKPGRGRG